MSNKSPSISTPQGGGALNGLGEKFSPDLFTGTGNFSVPIALPPGRNGFQPELTLGYSTGNGNGPFGLGWNLSLPGVTRKTSKGIPVYDDDTDVFILSGAEDLVLVKDEQTDDSGIGHRKQYYRPRTEGLFARIIHHTKSNGENYWQVNSKDGLVSYYGSPGVTSDDPCVIASPEFRAHIFAWRLSKTVDPFGNKIVYSYERDLLTYGLHQYDQLYLSKINYVDYPDGEDEKFLAEIRFNYQQRPDSFSEYKQGFEIRTTKRCDSIAIYTNAAELTKTKTYDFIYLDEQVTEQLLPINRMSMLTSVQVTGHNGNDTEKMPPLTFSYSNFEPKKRDLFPVKGDDLPNTSLADPSIELVDLTGNGLPDILQMNGNVRWWRNKGNGEFDRPKFMSDAPAGLQLADPEVQMIDANGDGRADLLVNKPGLSGYFSTRFGGTWDKSSFQKYKYAPTFGLEDPEVKLVDMNGDGVTDILRNGAKMEIFLNNPELGFYKSIGVSKKQLDDFPNVNFSDQRIRMADMTGDGMQDVVMIQGRNVSYWPNMGYGRWGKKISMLNAPELPFRYNPSRLLLGDIDGDGLADLMYIDSGRVLLWMNRSGNSWSEMIEIKGTPQTDDMDSVRLTDLLGLGVSGILWSGIPQPNRRAAMFFLDFTAGNKPYLLQEMDNHMGSITRVQYTSSIKYYLEDEKSPVTRWKTELPFSVLVVSKVEVIDAISLGKLATTYSYHHGYWDGQEREFRGFGRVDQHDTESFTRYNDTLIKLGGIETSPQTKPFIPVSEEYYTPPTETRTWFHQGPMGDPFSGWYEADYSDQYWSGDKTYLQRPDATKDLLKSLPPLARRDALRTLRGTVLRSELYALDNTPLQGRPYTVTESVSGVRTEFAPVVTDTGKVTEALYSFNYSSGYIFFPFGVAQRSSQWERGIEPMSSFSFTDNYDDFGQAQTSIGIAVPRYKDFRKTDTAFDGNYLATRSHSVFIYQGELSSDEYLLMVNRTEQSKTWDYTNEADDEVLTYYLSVLDETADHNLIGHSLNFYDGDAFEGLSLGALGSYGVLTRSEMLIVTPDILTDAYGGTPNLLEETPDFTDYPSAFETYYNDTFVEYAGYLYKDGTVAPYLEGYYTNTARNKYDFQEDTPTSERGLMVAGKDPLGNLIAISYDEYLFLPVSVKQYISPPEISDIYLETTADYDYRVLQPYQVTDPNENLTAFNFSPLGLLIATAIVGKGETDDGDWISDSGSFNDRYVPSTRLEYDFFNYVNNGDPVWVKTTKREYHYRQFINDNTIVSVEYSDGFGRLLQTRAQAEDTIYGDSLFGDSGLPADQEAINQSAIGYTRAEGPTLNVVVSGWQVYNNKGKVVKKYEPYFAKGFDFKNPVQSIGEIENPFVPRLNTGKGGYITFPDADQYHFGTDDFSIEMRFYLPDNGGNQTLFCNQQLTAPPLYAGIKIYMEDGFLYMDIGDGGGSARGKCMIYLQPGQWYHLVFIRIGNDPTDFKCYLNGSSNLVTQDGTNTLSSGDIGTSLAALHFGSREGMGLGSDNPYRGSFIDVRLYHRELTSAEILYNYKAPIHSMPSNMDSMVLWAPVDDDTNELADWSTYNADGQVEGNNAVWLKAACVQMYYDPRGKVIRTLNPDGSQQLVVFGVPTALDAMIVSGQNKAISYTPTPWESYTYDAENLDTESDHYATPKSAEVDALGRSIKTMDRLVSNNDTGDNVRMLYTYDIRGNLLEVTDALDRTVFQYTYDLRPPAKEGESIPPLKTTHIDKGTSTVVYDCMGKPLQGDDAKGALTLSAFDTIMRPINAWARDVTGEDITLRQVMIYGTTTTVNVNNKGKLTEHYDEAGYEGTFNYDFKGNLLNKYRQVISDTELLSVFDGPPTDWDVQCYRVDWTGGPSILDSEAYHTDMSYDALNRIMTLEYPEDTESERKILTPTYNKAGALQSVTLDSVEYVKEIAYNARGQRLLIALGNGIMTRYTYDPTTFRLQRLKTEGYTYTETSSPPLYQKKYDYNSGTTKQDFAYGYDLVGNILSINNTTPGCGNGGSDELNRQFTYDALYRLLSGTGRENQPNISWFPGWDDSYRSYNAGTTTGYSQSYNYDRMGNFISLAHSGSTSFTRNFDYISGKNILDSITIGGDSYSFDYDSNGNLITENTERHFEWDYADQMRCFFNQTGTSEPSVYTQYLYAGGTRIKKITRKSSGDKYITVYIDGIFEHSYHLDGSNTKDEELNELHIMDDQTRVAMLRTGHDDGTPFTKYILSDHLGSSNVILETDGSVYNREEYYPFGETSFGSFGKKRYRYVGKEKDEESGLYYYGARYFQPWSCRFISVDPLALQYNYQSSYAYADDNPICKTDYNGEGTGEGGNPEANISNTSPSTGIAPGAKIVHSLDGKRLYNYEDDRNWDYADYNEEGYWVFKKIASVDCMTTADIDAFNTISALRGEKAAVDAAIQKYKDTPRNFTTGGYVPDEIAENARVAYWEERFNNTSVQSTLFGWHKNVDKIDPCYIEFEIIFAFATSGVGNFLKKGIAGIAEIGAEQWAKRVAAKTGTALVETASDILKPGGKLIGTQVGRNAAIRTVTQTEAQSVVNRLISSGAKLSPKPGYPGVWYQLPNGGGFGVRNVVSQQSIRLGSSGAIDLNIPEIALKNLKF